MPQSLAVTMKTLLVVCASLAIVAATFAAEKVQKPAVLQKTFFRDVPRPPKSDDHSSLKIWNGQIAKRGQFPYYVGVYIDVSSFCGGSLIHPKWVLTAAHCVDGGLFWTLFMGVTRMNLPYEEGREVHVSRGGIKHPEYDSSRIVNDIGLIQLLNDVSTSADIATIPLTPPGASYVGSTATVAGFGVTSDSSSTISDVLRYTSMPIVDPDVCYNVYGDKDESQLCLETDQVMTSSCSGDSGGPLILLDTQGEPFLVGATSFGAQAGCAKGYPVGFTNIAIFIEWISKSTGINFDTTK